MHLSILPERNIEQNSETPHIGKRSYGSVRNHFRRQKLGTRIGFRVGQVLQEVRTNFLRRSEIDESDDSFRRIEDQIFRLEVEVDDVLGVKVGEGLKDLMHVGANGRF